jgi:hypothetical protein
MPISPQVSAHQLLLPVTIEQKERNQKEPAPCFFLTDFAVLSICALLDILLLGCRFNHSFCDFEFQSPRNLQAKWACIIQFFMPQSARLCPKAKFQGLPPFCVFSGCWQRRGVAHDLSQRSRLVVVRGENRETEISSAV